MLPLNTSAAAGIRRWQKRCANRGSRQYRQRRRLRRSSRHSSPSKSSDEDEDNLASRNQATGIGRVNAPGNVSAVSSANHSASMLQDASLPIGTAMLCGSTVYVFPGITIAARGESSAAAMRRTGHTSGAALELMNIA